MTPRLASAICALTAAALLALSVAGIPWAFWDGHPSMIRVNDAGEKTSETITAKTVHVGPLGATGCNTGGDDNCSSLPMPAAFSITGYGTLGASGALILALIALGIATLQTSERRKFLAKLAIGGAVLATIAAATMLAQGAAPKTSTAVTLPLGPGIFMFFIAIAAAVAGSVLAMRPTPKIELRPSRAAIAGGLPAPPSAQPVDVLALLQEDSLRPAALGPEPMIGRPPAQAAGPLPGLSGPLGAPQSSPLFNAAPQLRPLYDVDPARGGTSGYVPGTQPPLPTTPPTPVPRANVAAMAGIPTPASIAAQPPPRTATAQGAAAIPSIPPPPHAKPPTLAPPLPPNRTKPLSVAPTTNGPTPPNRTRPLSVPPPPGVTTARLNASSVPAPARAPLAPTALPTTPRTLAAAVAPPPPAAPPPPVINAKLPVRPATDPSDHLETVARPREPESIGDSTDANVSLGDEHTAPSAPLDTEEAPIVVPRQTDTEEAPIVGPTTETMDIETGVVEKLGAAEALPRAASQLETETHARLSARELGEAKTEVELIHRAKPAEPPAPPFAEPAAAAAAESAAPKIPITTAPDSLPPPKEKQAATTGPSPACPQCESPMAWVEEHLRFYCKSCRMYF